MADLVQTAANVRVKAGATTEDFTAGESIVPGDVVYIDSTDSKAKKASDATAAQADVKGMAASYAEDGTLVNVVKKGTVDVGAAATEGETYVASGAAGKWAPVGDLATGNFVTTLGRGNSDGDIELAISASGIAKP